MCVWGGMGGEGDVSQPVGGGAELEARESGSKTPAPEHCSQQPLRQAVCQVDALASLGPEALGLDFYK